MEMTTVNLEDPPADNPAPTENNSSCKLGNYIDLIQIYLYKMITDKRCDFLADAVDDAATDVPSQDDQSENEL